MKPRRGDQAADEEARPRRAAPRRTSCSTSTIRQDATGAVPDDRTIVVERVARRARRLARLRPHAVRRTHSRAVGDGGHGESARRAGHRRRDDVERRRLHRPLPRDRRAAARGAGHPRCRTRSSSSSSASSARARCSPRSSARPRRARCCCRARARRPHAALAAAQARLRPAAGRVALRLVPDHPRGVSRMPARRLRRAARSSRRCARSASGRSASSPPTREKPSPFAGSLLFRYVANFIYDGDAPLAERRAQALAIDQAQLRELLGEPELRELLDPDALAADSSSSCSISTSGTRRRSSTRMHDLLLRIGDLTTRGDRRATSIGRAPTADRRAASKRAPHPRSPRRAARSASSPSKTPAATATRSARRCRTASPSATSQPVADPAGDLVLRYARTHGPFTPAEVAQRYGLGVAVVTAALERFVERGTARRGRVPPRRHAARVVRRRRAAHRSAAARWRKLRKEVEPVEPPAFARLIASLAGRDAQAPRTRSAARQSIETLQGAPLPASIFESEILAARVDGLPAVRSRHAQRRRRDRLGRRRAARRTRRPHRALPDRSPAAAARRAGGRDGAARTAILDSPARARRVVLRRRSKPRSAASPNDLVDALWDLVWRGVVTNDTFHALRAFTTRPEVARRARRAFRSRRVAPPSTQGRWSLRRRRRAGTPRSAPTRSRSSSWRATAS